MWRTILPLAFIAACPSQLDAQQFGDRQDLAHSFSDPDIAVVADLTGDGLPDLLMSDERSNGFFYLLCFDNLAGDFSQAEWDACASRRFYAVCAGDVDLDGDVDLITSADNQNAHGIFVEENLSPGSPLVERFLFPSIPSQLELHDVDLDGDLDIIGTGADLIWSLNDGQGNFSTLSSRSPRGRNLGDICIADVNGDSYPDCVAVNGLTSGVRIVLFENNGRGGFKAQQDLFSWSKHSIQSLDLGDIDGDGDVDISFGISGRSGSSLDMLRNTGGGTFGQPEQVWSDYFPGGPVHLADIDLDGDLDVVSAGASGTTNNGLAWLANDGTGAFGQPELIDQPRPSFSLAIENLDFDGDLDLVAFHRSYISWNENVRASDSDLDGLPNDLEDLNGNGSIDPGETDPFDQDSDDDGLSDGEEVHRDLPDTRWLLSPSGVYYRLAKPDSWSGASGNARAEGAELASIGSVDEEVWLLETFGATSETAWIGLNDFGGNFQWSDGSALTYTHWGPGEPSASFVAAFVGGASFSEPGAWYTEIAGASSRRSVWELHSSSAPVAHTNPLNWDSDGDGLSDGLEYGLVEIVWDGDLDGDGNPDVGGTDPALFVADLDPLSTTSPIDVDSDDDGLADGVEDLNGDGAASPGETLAHDSDSDLDGLPDGIELGLEYGTFDTDGRIFLSDDDPTTTTDPLNSDSDGGGVPDGVEDQDRNGAVDTWDTDPNDTNDEALAVYFSGIVPGGTVHIEVWNATPLETIIPAFSLRGPGPTPTGLGINVDLSRPITSMGPFLSDTLGRASLDRLPIPPNAPLGIPVWLQAVEVSLSSSMAPRASNPVLIPIGTN